MPCVIAVGLVALLCGAGGCASTQIGSGPVYPAAATRTGSLDIHVIRRGTRIELTNTTARAFGRGTLWLNGYWGRTLDGLAVGESLDLSLRDFRDEYGEPFRAGGFFAREKPDKIVLAELEVEGKLLGLVVVPGEGE